MSSLLNLERRTLLLGDEAVARGALEAGLGAFSTYPGTPASEIGDSLAGISEEAGIFFEYAVNEIIAVETVIAFSLSGYRSMAAMKHVGLNVAADAFMTFPYLGVGGGAVIVTADDPGCHSSQNEQDNRHFARMAQVPMIEPSSPREACLLTKRAFELSEEVHLPVLLRLTTRIAHMRGPVDPAPLPTTRIGAREFKRDPMNRVMVPSVARLRHAEVIRMLENAALIADSPEFHGVSEGDSDLGIIAVGHGRNLVESALSDLGLNGRVGFLELAFTYPFPERTIADFLKRHRRVLVVEELTPFMEDAIAAIAHRRGCDTRIFGKHTGHFSELGELNPDLVTNAVADLTCARKSTTTEIVYADDSHESQTRSTGLPQRRPSLCPGCPHRATYLMTRQAIGAETIVATDIGCYTLGLFPPLGMGDLQVCMGGSVSLGAALAAAIDQPVAAFIGDSTFFHAGIPGLINAVSHRRRLMLVVMDNLTTAMTGYQPHPGSPADGHRRVMIEDVAAACGADSVMTVDPNDVRSAMDAISTAWDSNGVSVVVMRSPCARQALRDGLVERRPPVRIDNGGPDNLGRNACSQCTTCIEMTGCPALHLEKGARGPEVIQDLCTGCGLCITVCPNGAIVPDE
ncbi:MAG: indolepyruvate ferredoxin oxidoreductase subunit alpha [Deltaproteobacteria bacterium]|nr:indolepyruvate ferredoxin oxidoreductase subunit alpha [Deltaproteobacteria bacterium]